MILDKKINSIVFFLIVDSIFTWLLDYMNSSTGLITPKVGYSLLLGIFVFIFQCWYILLKDRLNNNRFPISITECIALSCMTAMVEFGYMVQIFVSKFNHDNHMMTTGGITKRPNYFQFSTQTTSLCIGFAIFLVVIFIALPIVYRKHSMDWLCNRFKLNPNYDGNFMISIVFLVLSILCFGIVYIVIPQIPLKCQEVLKLFYPISLGFCLASMGDKYKKIQSCGIEPTFGIKINNTKNVSNNSKNSTLRCYNINSRTTLAEDNPRGFQNTPNLKNTFWDNSFNREYLLLVMILVIYTLMYVYMQELGTALTMLYTFILALAISFVVINRGIKDFLFVVGVILLYGLIYLLGNKIGFNITLIIVSVSLLILIELILFIFTRYSSFNVVVSLLIGVIFILSMFFSGIQYDYDGKSMGYSVQSGMTETYSFSNFELATRKNTVDGQISSTNVESKLLKKLFIQIPKAYDRLMLYDTSEQVQSAKEMIVSSELFVNISDYVDSIDSDILYAYSYENTRNEVTNVSDYVFVCIVRIFGSLFTVILLLILYSGIGVIPIISIFSKCSEFKASHLVAFSSSSLIMVSAIVHITSSSGLSFNTGITLPFISDGNQALICYFGVMAYVLYPLFSKKEVN